LVGYATKWSAVSRVPKLYGYCIRFAAGAFTDSIASDEIFAVWNHDWEEVLAINRNLVHGTSFGVLNLREDGHGLAVEIEPPDNWQPDSPVFRDIRSGRIRGMSIEFKSQEARIDRLASGLSVCTVIRAKLNEVSPVYFPAIVESSIRLIEPAANVQPAEPAAAPASHREIIRVDPALVSNRRRYVHAGMAINC
jgi:HK97 family phage prohead protease